MKKIAWIVVGIVAILLILIVFKKEQLPTQVSVETIKIGAILPLTGPTAIWGENVKNGMDMFQQDLKKKGVTLDVIYEDGGGDPVKSLAAYNKLVQTDKVDVIVSILSRSSVPLIEKANTDKVSLIVSLVGADGVTTKDGYTLRYFPTAKQLTSSIFEVIKEKKYKKVAFLFLKDEYGRSVKDVAKELAANSDITIVADEGFDPQATDFRTSLLKIKNTNPEAILFLGTSPSSITTAFKQYSELGMTPELFEVSNQLTVNSIRNDIGKAGEGSYTIAYDSSLSSKGKDFAQKYESTYGKDPVWAASYGYDLINIISLALDESGNDLAAKIKNLQTFEGLNGKVKITSDGELNPPVRVVQIVNGELVPVK